MYLWDLFLDARRFLESTGFGRAELGAKSLEAWSNLKRHALDGWEFDAILSCDTPFLNAINPPKAQA
jgi:hypothetical protein